MSPVSCWRLCWWPHCVAVRARAGAAGALVAAWIAAPPLSTLSRKPPPDFFGGAVRSIEACCVVGG